MAESDFNYVKTIVRSVLVSSPGTMTILQVLKDYALLEGKDLSYTKLGFSSIYTLLNSMQDILQLPPNPNMYSPVKLIVNKKTSHLVELVEKQKPNKKKNAKKKGSTTHKFNSHILPNSHKNINNNIHSSTKNNNYNARGYDFVKSKPYSSPKPKGYVTNELKEFIKTLCHSKNPIRVPKLKSNLINHPDYCKLNSTNIEEAINMLKTFIYIDKSGVHLKDSKFNILHSREKLQIQNHMESNFATTSKSVNKHKNKTQSVIKYKNQIKCENSRMSDGFNYYSKKETIANNENKSKLDEIEHCSDFSNEYSDSEYGEFGLIEGLNYFNQNNLKQDFSKDRNNSNKLDYRKLKYNKNIRKLDKKLSNGNDNNINVCDNQSNNFNLCGKENNNLSEDILSVSKNNLKTIYKLDEELSIQNNKTKDACYILPLNSNLCSEYENNSNKNHLDLNNDEPFMKYDEIPKIYSECTLSESDIVEESELSEEEFSTSVSDSCTSDKYDYIRMVHSIIKERNSLTVNNVFEIFKAKHGYDFPFQKFGCISCMDFFRLHPALFELKNSFSSTSIVTLQKNSIQKKPITIRKYFINASIFEQYPYDKPENQLVEASASTKEYKLNSKDTNQYKEYDGDTQISIINTQARISSPNSINSSITSTSTNTTNYEIYDSDLVSDSMKEKMRYILKQYKNGILCNVFMDIYANEYNSGFTFSDYGFRSMRDMAFQLPSVFYVKQNKEDGEYFLYDAHKRNELENNITDPSIYYKNIPMTVMHNLSTIFDRYRTGISIVELRNLYCTDFGRCYEPLKYGYSSEEHMFESLNKMIEIKNNELHTLDPFAYINIIEEEDIVTDNSKKYSTLPMLNWGLLNYSSNDICTRQFRYSPFKLNENKFILVYTAEVYHPNSFYIHLESKMSTLKYIMANLQDFYHRNEKKYTVSPELLIPGLACCLQFKNTRKWHRAIILEIVDENFVKVSYIDFGSHETVEKTRIRLLISKFGIEPILALHCCLYEEDEFFFRPEINKLFFEIVNKNKLDAYFDGYRYQDNGVQKMKLQLYLNTKIKRLHVNKICAKKMRKIAIKSTSESIRRKLCELEMKDSKSVYSTNG